MVKIKKKASLKALVKDSDYDGFIIQYKEFWTCYSLGQFAIKIAEAKGKDVVEVISDVTNLLNDFIK